MNLTRERVIRWLPAALLLVACPGLVMAQYFPPGPLPSLSMKASAGPRAFVSHQRAKINGRLLDYAAAVEETTIAGSGGLPSATFFTTTYQLEKGRDLDKRPVVFVFNGGPGAAAAPLMLAGTQ